MNEILPVISTAAVAAVVAAAAVTYVLIIVLFPLLQRYALARPNARSSHKVPTPQGGGIAIVASVLVITAAWMLLASAPFVATAWVLASALLLAVVGAVDDIVTLRVSTRLGLQAVAVATAVLLGMGEGRILPAEIPLAVERAVAILAILWFVNLTNFMDGLDWIVVAAKVPLLAAVLGFAIVGFSGGASIPVAAALLGALLGFAPFNRPVARLFLGDVGSLAIGLLSAWLLYSLAAAGQVAAAFILPLYFCADATLTLLRRLSRREKVWIAHRTHFYQRATDNGFTAMRVARDVFALNCALAVLAASTLWFKSTIWDLSAVMLAAAMVAVCLYRFARPRASEVTR